MEITLRRTAREQGPGKERAPEGPSQQHGPDRVALALVLPLGSGWCQPRARMGAPASLPFSLPSLTFFPLSNFQAGSARPACVCVCAWHSPRPCSCGCDGLHVPLPVEATSLLGGLQ